MPIVTILTTTRKSEKRSSHTWIIWEFTLLFLHNVLLNSYKIHLSLSVIVLLTHLIHVQIWRTSQQVFVGNLWRRRVILPYGRSLWIIHATWIVTLESNHLYVMQRISQTKFGIFINFQLKLLLSGRKG